MSKIKQSFFCLLFFIAPTLFAIEEIFSKDGNLYYANTRITSIGKDRLPVLSADKKVIVFVRSGNDPVPEECSNLDHSDDKHADQIWVYDVENKKEYLLVASKLSCNKPEEAIVNIHELKFSPDNKTLYFLTSAWDESDALHVVTISGTHQHYLAPAISFEVVLEGENKGNLYIKQRRYFSEGGSFDWYWLFTADGKEIAPIGPDITEPQKLHFDAN